MPDIPCPVDSLGRSTCAEFIRAKMNAIARKAGQDGVDVVVSTAKPLVASPYGTNGYRCPHLVTYWVAPTGEQMALWAKLRIP